MTQRFGISARQLKAVFSTAIARRRSQGPGRSSSLLGLAAVLSVAILLAVTTSAVAEDPIEDPPEVPGLVAAYSFDAGQGALVEDTFAGHDGTIQGSATWAEGKYGRSLKFDGDDDCVSIPDSADLQLGEAFTLEAWIRPDNATQWAPVFFKESEDFYSYSLFFGAFNAGHIQGWVTESESEYAEVESPGTLTANNWSHIAMTSDATTLRLYVNGNLVDSASSVAAMESEKPLWIGCSGLWDEKFEGRIDEARIYDRALSQEEVKFDKDHAIQTPPSPAPVAAYGLDSGQGQVAKDAAASHDGTIQGATWTEGKFGKALSFDGVDDCLSVPNSVDLQLSESFTLEAWINPTNATQWAPVFFKESEDFYSYSLFFGAFNAGHVQGYVTEAPQEWSEVESPGTLTANTWSHIAMTSDRITLRLYVNGTLVDSASATDAMESEKPLWIGCSGLWDEKFKGKIDEARIYNRALTQEEVKADKDQAIQTAPQAITGAVSQASATEATLPGVVNPKGGATTFYFEYGPTTSYGSKAPAVPKAAGNGNGNVGVEQVIGGLTEDTEYHFRLVATNEAGTTNGLDQTFKTPVLPDAVTEPSAAVSPSEAILSATVDANGSPTTYRFQYGETTAYGSVVPTAEEERVTGTDDQDAEEAVSYLDPNTTYHYRVVASNAGGTVVGEDKVLTTPPSLVGPQQEAEERQEELAFTAKFTGPLPDSFINIQWGGLVQANPKENESKPERLEIIRGSGAKMIRLHIGNLNQYSDGSWWQGYLDEMFVNAAKRKMRLLIGLGGAGPIPSEPEWAAWSLKAKEVVKRYGKEGALWAKEGMSDEYAPVWWEIWNEPNIEKNGTTGPKKVEPFVFGHFVEVAANAVRSVKGNGGAKVVVGGVLSVRKDPGDAPEEVTIPPAQFVREMGHRSAYDAVGLHPYTFNAKYEKNCGDVKNCEGPPRTDEEIATVTERTRNRILEVRDALDGPNGQYKNDEALWITEIGWPVKTWDTTHTEVTPQIQAKLIRSSFQMIKANSKAWNIDNIFYYNAIDNRDFLKWDHRIGLQDGDGLFRPAWYAFQEEAGVPISWPAKVVAVGKGASASARTMTLRGEVNPDGLSTEWMFRWGDTTDYKNQTPWRESWTGQGAPPVVVSEVVSNLDPNHTYHFKFFARNNADPAVAASNDMEIKTGPPTSVSADHTRVLHGNPGWVWVSGWAKEGAIDGDGPGLTNVNVRVNFKRDKAEPNPVISKEVPVVNGQYNTGFVAGLGRGEWFYKAVLPAQGGYTAAESAYHDFRVYDGVRIIAKHSQKCMDVSGASTANGVSIMQGSCLPPTTAQNQVFSLVPKPDGYEVVARHSGKCLDVEGAVTTDGARIMQHECIAAVHLNQEFDETWWGPSQYAYYSAKHSGKCIEVQGASTAWAQFQQASCNGADHQLLRLEPVDSGPIPSETTFDIDQILHGTPGLVSFHGWLKAGTYPMGGRVVRIEFDNATVAGWDSSGGNLPVTVAANGYYEVRDFEVPPGYWNVRARFVGGAEFAESLSGVKPNETIKRGYLARNRYSNKCLALNEGKSANGTAFIQWPCSAVNGNGQVFSFRPRGGNWYDIKPNGAAGRCFDVQGASAANYAWTQLYDCLGAAQYNQHWKREPIAGQPGWFALIARHSSKCASTNGWTEANGSRIVQYDCVWAGNQQWDLQGVVNP